MERAKQQQQQPSQSSGPQSSATAAPASKPLPVNGTGGGITKDGGAAAGKDVKSSHKSLHDGSKLYVRGKNINQSINQSINKSIN